MLFTTAQYGIFFVAVFTVHWLLPQRLRRPFLLLASYVFYASAIPKYILLILGLTTGNYVLGLWLGRTRGRGRKAVLVLAIAFNLASLAYFKYAQFLATTTENLLRHLPMLSPITMDPWVLSIVLPLGISFFTFEFIHYQAEVYKGMAPERHPVDFALFAAFFPTQIAGPIKRFPAWIKQLQHPTPLHDIDIDGSLGLILRGLLKKVLFADLLSSVVGQLFANPAHLGPMAAWFAIVAFAAQIYGDFSGYTDIGRGCAALLGYWVPENFNRPYQSANPGEFWHRWHMSLSTWLRDYLYIPLGGSRVSRPRIYLNLMITMALGGLWHGASWHFMVWGVYQGAILCGHRLWSETVGKAPLYKRLMAFPLCDFLARPVTFVLVCVGWVFFRADSVGASLQMLASTVAFNRPLTQGMQLSVTSTPVLLLAIAGLIVVGGWVWAVAQRHSERLARGVDALVAAASAQMAYVWALRPALYVIALTLLTVVPQGPPQRFIYFQF